MVEGKTLMRMWPAALVLLAATACGSKHIPYTPETGMSMDQAVKSVQRGLEEQPPTRFLVDVDVTPERLSAVEQRSKAHIWTGGTSMVGVPVVSYFDSIRSVDLYEKRGQSIVIIKHQDGRGLRFEFREQPAAQRFIDGIETLREAASGNSEPRGG